MSQLHILSVWYPKKLNIIVICFEERLQLFTRGKRAWYSKRTELLINHALQRLLSCKVNDA